MTPQQSKVLAEVELYFYLRLYPEHVVIDDVRGLKDKGAAEILHYNQLVRQRLRTVGSLAAVKPPHRIVTRDAGESDLLDSPKLEWEVFPFLFQELDFSHIDYSEFPVKELP